jgi:hypothetical protein
MELLGEWPGGITLLRIQDKYQWEATVRLATVLTNTLCIQLLVNTVRFSVNFFSALKQIHITDGQGNTNKVWNEANYNKKTDGSTEWP